MIRRANKCDIPRIIEFLHQVNMVHHVIRPDLFKPHTTKYNELELGLMLTDDTKPIFAFVLLLGIPATKYKRTPQHEPVSIAML